MLEVVTAFDMAFPVPVITTLSKGFSSLKSS